MTTFRIISTCLLICSFCSSSINALAQDYSLTGKIKGVDVGWAFIRHRQTGNADSVRISNGAFTVEGNVNDAEFCSFGLSADGVKDYYFSFFLEKGKLGLAADKDSLNDISVQFSGSKVEKEFQRFQKLVSGINQMHYSNEQADDKLEQLSRSYALKHPDSYVSAFALMSYENTLTALSELYAALSPKIQKSYFGTLIYDKIMRK